MWFLLKHTREIRYRNWANGLIGDIKKVGVVYEDKQKTAEDLWDLKSLEWDSCAWEFTLKNKIQGKSKFKSAEEAKIAFFTSIERFKNQGGDDLKIAFGPTSYNSKFTDYLDEFIWQKGYFEEDCKVRNKK